jgi:transcriptional regulator with XRE-family HTH domain
MPRFRNDVGPQIAKQRTERGLTQEQFAARLQLLGLRSIDRVGVVKIETRIRSVFDFELRLIAEALKMDMNALFPSTEQLRRDLADLRKGQRTTRRQ